MFKFNNVEEKQITYFFASIAAFLFIAVVFSPLLAAQEKAAQIVFHSPEEAMKVFVEAIQADDMQKVLAILGPQGKDIIYSGDEVADKNNHAKFVKSYQEKVNFVKDKDVVSVIIGKDDYPLAIPIIKKEGGWVFDINTGLQELLKRRIGRNELSAINACRTYVQAQREYISAQRSQDGIMQYAQKFCSAPGKRDGLFWQEAQGEPPSPLGPVFVAASQEGYTPGEVCMISPAPYHGYHYKILAAQGIDAPGGQYSYLINGYMVAGFALIAWPAEYSVSGVMTFIVNQNGIVYEKNFGPRTDELARAVTEYNPDSTWSRAE